MQTHILSTPFPAQLPSMNDGIPLRYAIVIDTPHGIQYRRKPNEEGREWMHVLTEETLTTDSFMQAIRVRDTLARLGSLLGNRDYTTIRVLPLSTHNYSPDNV